RVNLGGLGRLRGPIRDNAAHKFPAVSVEKPDSNRPFLEGIGMKTSTDRILTTHVGSIPRPESLRVLLRARLAGQAIDQKELDTEVERAVTDVVRKQAESGIDVVNDGERGKSSFLAYSEDRLDGFAPVPAGHPN